MPSSDASRGVSAAAAATTVAPHQTADPTLYAISGSILLYLHSEFLGLTVSLSSQFVGSVING